MKTPVTYWGGKQQLTPRILSYFPQHKVYDEPFFGGGAIFFAKRPSEVEFINDVNGEMINFYRTIKNNFKPLKQEVDSTLHSEYEHHRARKIYATPSNYTEIERAWAIWVLSKQSIYSILNNSWSMTVERNMAKSIQWSKEAFAEAYAKRLERTSIFCRDALDVIKATDTEDTFHYVDPPYFNSNLGHYDGYTIDDFRNLLEILSDIEGKFLLSSYPSEILSEYAVRNNWSSEEIEMYKSAGSKGGRKVEVLTMNYTTMSKQGTLF